MTRKRTEEELRSYGYPLASEMLTSASQLSIHQQMNAEARTRLEENWLKGEQGKFYISQNESGEMFLITNPVTWEHKVVNGYSIRVRPKAKPFDGSALTPSKSHKPKREQLRF